MDCSNEKKNQVGRREGNQKRQVTPEKGEKAGQTQEKEGKHGALQSKETAGNFNLEQIKKMMSMAAVKGGGRDAETHMYSMVPQKVCVF